MGCLRKQVFISLRQIDRGQRFIFLIFPMQIVVLNLIGYQFYRCGLVVMMDQLIFLKNNVFTKIQISVQHIPLCRAYFIGLKHYVCFWFLKPLVTPPSRNMNYIDATFF